MVAFREQEFDHPFPHIGECFGIGDDFHSRSYYGRTAGRRPAIDQNGAYPAGAERRVNMLVIAK